MAAATIPTALNIIPPSPALTATTLLIVAVGAALPFTPLAHALGFTPLPAVYFVFLVIATVTYLFLVEIAKRRLMPSVAMKNHYVARPRHQHEAVPRGQ